MALQAPTRIPANLCGNSGLRQAPNGLALKSSFFSPSIHLLLPPPSLSATAPATAPRISMRVASKQAYICRDCGYIYNDRTPFEKLPDSYFCPASGFRLTDPNSPHVELIKGSSIYQRLLHSQFSNKRLLVNGEGSHHPTTLCDVCGAPKRRFRAYEPKVTKDANSTEVRKARKEQMKRDEAVGNILPIAIGVGVVALAALYFYVNYSS